MDDSPDASLYAKPRAEKVASEVHAEAGSAPIAEMVWVKTLALNPASAITAVIAVLDYVPVAAVGILFTLYLVVT